MLEVRVKQLVNLDNLSQGKSWKLIHDKLLESYNEEEVMLDFLGIMVHEPWTIKEFDEILKMKNIYFRFRGNDREELDKFCNKIKIKCIMQGYLVDRIESVFTEPIRVKTKEELKIDQATKTLYDKFVMNEELQRYEIHLYKLYDQVCSTHTALGLIEAAKQISEKTGVKEFIVVTNRMYIQSNILKLFAENIIALDIDYGITLNFDMTDEKLAKELGLYIYTMVNESYTDFTKLKAILQVKANTPGLLLKYKGSKAIDEFGRQGKGEVISNRIAIYKGIYYKSNAKDYDKLENIELTEDGGVIADVISIGHNRKKIVTRRLVHIDNIYILVNSYYGNEFMTKTEIMNNHDGELVDDNGDDVLELRHEKTFISLNELGLMDKFLGSRYHFMKPIQHSKEENKVIIIGYDDDGKCIKKDCTIPERMKTVFIDWGVPFDGLALEKAIRETNNLLK